MIVSLLVLIFTCSIAGAAWLDFIFTKEENRKDWLLWKNYMLSHRLIYEMMKSVTLEDAILIAQEALVDDKEDNISDYYYRIYGCELLEFDDEGSVYNVAFMPQQLEKSIYPNTIVWII